MTQPGEEAWERHSTPFERVWAIVLGLSEPRSATFIAQQAFVSDETARAHLDRLVELSIVLEHDAGGQTTYVTDSLYTRFRTAQDLLDSHDGETLRTLRDELQDRIETWCAEYNVASPEELRKRGTVTESSVGTEDLHQTANEWELVEYRLNIVDNVIDYCST